MTRPFTALLAAFVAAALVLLGTASCKSRNVVAGAAAEPPPQPRTCPDGRVIIASEYCLPAAPGERDDAPTANGDGETHHGGGGAAVGAVIPGIAGNGADISGDDDYYYGRRYRGDEDDIDVRAARRTWRAARRIAYRDGAVPVGAPGVIDEAGQQVFPGLGAFADPGDMEVENWFPLRFLLGPDKRALEMASGGHELGQPYRIYIGKKMRVTLPADDPNFLIMRQSREVVDIGLDKTAAWAWKVKPLNAGTHTLIAHVEILELGPDGEPVKGPDGSLKTLDDYDREVKISVKVGTWRGFLNAIKNATDLGDLLGTLFRSWEKTLGALAALIGAIGGVIVAYKKLRKG